MASVAGCATAPNLNSALPDAKLAGCLSANITAASEATVNIENQVRDIQAKIAAGETPSSMDLQALIDLGIVAGKIRACVEEGPR